MPKELIEDHKEYYAFINVKREDGSIVNKYVLTIFTMPKQFLLTLNLSQVWGKL